MRKESLSVCVALMSLIYVLHAILTSCSNSGCTENRNAVPLVAFYNASTDKTLTLDSLSITGVDQPDDSVITKLGLPIDQVYLPMRPTHESVKWCIAYKWRRLDYPELNDTISFDYTSLPFFASEACGVYYRYHITEMNYTDHLIERVEIEDSLITNIDKVYVNIYFRAESDEQ